jgi:hypothetical protein
LVRDQARQRKAQAHGHPRGVKVLSRSPERHGESADAIGALLGVSGATVKRVDRVARVAPELLPKVAAGALSAQKALQQALANRPSARESPSNSNGSSTVFAVSVASRRLRSLIRAEWATWPREHRQQFLRTLSLELKSLVYAHTVNPTSATGGENDDLAPTSPTLGEPVRRVLGTEY